MGRLDDRLLNHPANGNVESLRGAIAELPDDVADAFEENAPGTLERLPKALTYIEAALKAADPQLVSEAKLEAISSGLVNTEQQLSQVAANPALASSLDASIEGALDSAASLMAMSDVMTERSEAVTERLDSSLEASVKDVAGRSESLGGELSALEERLREADETRTASDEERDSAMTAKFGELENGIEAEKQRLDQLVPQFEEQFKTAQDERQSAFDEVQDELKTNSEAVVTDLKENFEQTTTKLNDTAQEALNDVESKRAEVERLYGVITETATAGEFHKEADEQSKAADLWRWLTVVFGCIAAGLAIYASLLPHDKSPSLGEVVARVTATLAAGGVAAYAGRQSGRHREREEEAKRLELELVTFPSFIDSLDEEQQREVRKEFVQRAFRGRPADADGGRRWFRKQDAVGVLPAEQLADLAAAVVREVLARQQPKA